MVYAKPPFAGPEAVLAYLARYTHRVAISNSVSSASMRGVTFRYKDYRRDGTARQQRDDAGADEFIRRFLLHTLPRGFHRIRHYGLFASSAQGSLALARQLLAVPQPTTQDAADSDAAPEPWRRCPAPRGAMIVVEFLADHPAAFPAGNSAATREGSAVIPRRLNQAKADFHPAGQRSRLPPRHRMSRPR